MNSTGSRTPPVETRKKLRAEVHFGCPVEGCGNPYLSYHHFDPPWHIKQHHNPNGMIALCLQHHKEADGGAFTDEQLRETKQNSYLKKMGEFPKGRFNWRREQLLVLFGGNLVLGPEVILQVWEEPIIWLFKDEQGFEQLNLKICDSTRKTLFKMRDNDWLAYPPFDELECPPRGNSLDFRSLSNDLRIKLRFSMVSKSKLKRDWIWIKKVKQFIKDETITLCTLTGHLIWPINITLRGAELRLGRKLTVSRNVFFKRPAITIRRDGTIGIG